MTTLLHVAASPRGARSESLALATTFLDTLREVRPDVAVDTFNLWDGTLPAFGPDATAAKMAVFAGEEPSGAAAQAWRGVRATFERFAAADAYLFSVPMWNHGIPYVLKQLIDVVSQPGMVFSFDPAQGYTGLLTGRKAVVVLTSAVYGPGLPPSFGADLQAPFLHTWLRWAGITDITDVELRPDLVVADASTARQVAHAAARDAAKAF
jgi:FMN-dependent NADH-azoreductase